MDGERGFAGLGLPEFTMTQRLLTRGFSLDEAALAQRIPGDKLRQFYSFGLQTYNSGQVEIERRHQESEGKDYLRGTAPGKNYRLIDAATIRRLLELTIPADEIADQMQIDANDFRRWFLANRNAFKNIKEIELP